VMLYVVGIVAVWLCALAVCAIAIRCVEISGNDEGDRASVKEWMTLCGAAWLCFNIFVIVWSAVWVVIWLACYIYGLGQSA